MGISKRVVSLHYHFKTIKSKEMSELEDFKAKLKLALMKERHQLEIKLLELIELDKQSILSRNISRSEIGNLIGEVCVRLKDIEEDLKNNHN